jgi:hypothetical protein
MWPTPPGALRVRPLPRESAASYLTRLAAAYHLSPAQLLDGLHITATGTTTAPPATEMHLSNEAFRRLSHFTRIPPAHLARALPRRPPPAAIGTAHAATARWQPAPPAMQPLPACTACTIRRSPHQAVPAWIHPAPDLPRIMICTRHQQAASDRALCRPGGGRMPSCPPGRTQCPRRRGGSAAHSPGRWRSAAACAPPGAPGQQCEWCGTHRRALAERPLWLFSSGPPDASASGRDSSGRPLPHPIDDAAALHTGGVR